MAESHVRDEVEIYGLYDPDTNALCYIGKANNSAKRLKTHIQDSKTVKRPVCLWVKGLLAQSKFPRMEVLERVPAERWKAAERLWIGQHRHLPTLLNLAPGGDMPSQTREQRQAAARASNVKQAQNPQMKAFNKAKREMSRLYASFCKKPDYNAYTLRLLMKCHYANRPELHQCWANL